MFQTRPLPATTDLPSLQRVAPHRYPLLMESTASGTAQGRWDLLLMASGPTLALHNDGVVRDETGTVHEGTFLQVLDAHWQAARLPREETGLPFRGGWALMLDYELAGQIETVLALPTRADGLP
ncbi:aminodeoxychorismate synthase, component I, partial [Stenotrophomonas sp. 278]